MQFLAPAAQRELARLRVWLEEAAVAEAAKPEEEPRSVALLNAELRDAVQELAAHGEMPEGRAPVRIGFTPDGGVEIREWNIATRDPPTRAELDALDADKVLAAWVLNHPTLQLDTRALLATIAQLLDVRVEEVAVRYGRQLARHERDKQRRWQVRASVASLAPRAARSKAAVRLSPVDSARSDLLADEIKKL